MFYKKTIISFVMMKSGDRGAILMAAQTTDQLALQGKQSNYLRLN